MMAYRTFALALARKAGKIITRHFSLRSATKTKADASPVTAVDLAVHTLVVAAITKRFPSHTILSEEGTVLRRKSNLIWVCDPIDGTVAYAHGVPGSTFSLALVHGGVVILGVVYDPFHNRMFFAEKGKGAFLNGRRIHVSSDRQLPGSVIGMDVWLPQDQKLHDVEAELKRKKAFVLTTGSILSMGALVAAGGFAAVVFGGRHPHDSAAIKILVEEAGGKVTSIFGEEQRYDREVAGHLATNGLLHDELLAIIKRQYRRS